MMSEQKRLFEGAEHAKLYREARETHSEDLIKKLIELVDKVVYFSNTQLLHI